MGDDNYEIDSLKKKTYLFLTSLRTFKVVAMTQEYKNIRK